MIKNNSFEIYRPLAKKMREVYISGKMPDGVHQYRSNTTEVAKKLETFFEIYGEYTDDEIIDATKRYVASYRGNYRYAKALNNFVWKMESEEGEDGENHKVRHSYLADFLENNDIEENKVNVEDWTTKMI